MAKGQLWGLYIQSTRGCQIYYYMKALSIILLVLAFILPAGSCCYSATGADDLNAGLNLSTAPSAPEASDDESIKEVGGNAVVRWHSRRRHTKLKGVALVIHGLNCRPDKMEAIIEELNAGGIDCLNLSLQGHGTNFSPIPDAETEAARMAAFKSVSYPLWKSEAYEAYQFAKRKSDLYGRPLFLIGFSMGGLLGVDLMTANPTVRFDRMVLFAPAIAMHRRNYLIKVLAPFPNLVIPSAGHRSYLANDGTPMAAYMALFDMHAHFEKHLNPKKINIPTVVFIDDGDELVSFTRLRQMVQKQDLNQWTVHSVKKDKTATEVDMHHLIIDAASVGNNMWQEIVKVTITHLLGGQIP